MHNQKNDTTNECKEVRFIDLCNIFERIENTKSRLEIQEYLMEFYKKILKTNPNELANVLYLCNSKVFCDYYNLEMGVGDFMIIQCVIQATGLSKNKIKELLKKTGDISKIAMNHRVNQLFVSKEKLTVKRVIEHLRNLCFIDGKKSRKDKIDLILSDINLADPIETKYIIRLLEGKLKIGLALATILIGLAQAIDVDPGVLKSAYNKNPDFKSLVDIIIKFGSEGIEGQSKVKAGIPVKPMLATPTKHSTSAFSKFESNKLLTEFKYDGERLQIHHSSAKDSQTDKTVLFSRNLEDITIKYKDVANLKINDKSFIIDCEIVAFKDDKIQPFQLLSTRKRKNVDVIDVDVCVFVFDILYYDDEELVDKPLYERREILQKYFNEIPGKFIFTKSVETDDIEKVEEFFKTSLENNCEGVMLKDLNACYKPSHRSNKWIKLKKDYLDNLGDSLDLVVIGAYFGKGKRTNVYGGFLLGVYNTEINKYEACCKIGTGFSDEKLL
ncbi:DNL1, partial [Hepatospora eriocheir]